MSASEKIKALGPMTVKNQHGIPIREITLGYQLEQIRPQIVAVVEAAEAIQRNRKYLGDFPQLDAAVEALEEVLS